MKTGLALEGGAMRGLFTAGVLDIWMENGIRFDGLAGISAGALFGSNFKSGQIGRSIRYNMKYGRDPRYKSLRSLIRTGNLYGVEFCYHTIPEILDPFDWDAFRKNPMEFFIGATDVHTGKAVYYQCTGDPARDITWMQASASMPLVSRTVRIDGYELLDGGIVDAVPYACLENRGYDRNVIVLTQPLGYVKTRDSIQPLIRICLHRYPEIIRAMAFRYIRYNREMEEIRQREQEGKVFVIRPPAPLGIRRTESNPEELDRVYRIGRKEGEKNLEAVRMFLNGNC